MYGKISNFIVNRDHINKSKETRAVASTCRYSSGHLVPNSAPATDGIRIFAGVDCTTLLSSLFICMIPIDCKIMNFSLLFCLLLRIYLWLVDSYKPL